MMEAVRSSNIYQTTWCYSQKAVVFIIVDARTSNLTKLKIGQYGQLVQLLRAVTRYAPYEYSNVSMSSAKPKRLSVIDSTNAYVLLCQNLSHLEYFIFHEQKKKRIYNFPLASKLSRLTIYYAGCQDVFTAQTFSFGGGRGNMNISPPPPTSQLMSLMRVIWGQQVVTFSHD